MRTSSIFAMFCLASGIIPSLALPVYCSLKEDRFHKKVGELNSEELREHCLTYSKASQDPEAWKSIIESDPNFFHYVKQLKARIAMEKSGGRAPGEGNS
ncbi:hypothetical protein F5148DRAFT_1184027 [Russula earlei]|uniref:Uncharacterized protein n=1 Tax=Russula earlei TaxID=71964 RepID=A0ACC0UFL5_9AGAM|nr:hypothetical protein F5148DRAFT_1184027 [Russula earlei]